MDGFLTLLSMAICWCIVVGTWTGVCLLVRRYSLEWLFTAQRMMTAVAGYLVIHPTVVLFESREPGFSSMPHLDGETWFLCLMGYYLGGTLWYCAAKGEHDEKEKAKILAAIYVEFQSGLSSVSTPQTFQEAIGTTPDPNPDEPGTSDRRIHPARN